MFGRSSNAQLPSKRGAHKLKPSRNRAAAAPDIALVLAPYEFPLFTEGSGMVINYLQAWLEAQGILFPVNHEPDVTETFGRFTAILLCARPSECAARATRNAGVETRDETFKAAWADWTGEDWAAAPEIRRAALNWLSRLIAKGAAHDGTVLVIS